MTSTDNQSLYSKKELVKRLKDAEDSYKVYGFSHVIVTASLVDIMDTSYRKGIDGMYRKTKVHSQNPEEAEKYRQLLCKLYLLYIERSLKVISFAEPKLSSVLKVEVETPTQNTNEKLMKLRALVSEKTKRIQSLTVLHNLLKTDTVLAEWVVFKVEPIVREAEKDLPVIENISQNTVMTTLNSLHRIKNAFQSLEE